MRKYVSVSSFLVHDRKKQDILFPDRKQVHSGMSWTDQVLLSTEGYICGISTFLSPPRIFVQY